MTTIIRVTKPNGASEIFDDFDTGWKYYTNHPGARFDLIDPVYLPRLQEAR